MGAVSFFIRVIREIRDCSGRIQVQSSDCGSLRCQVFGSTQNLGGLAQGVEGSSDHNFSVRLHGQSENITLARIERRVHAPIGVEPPKTPARLTSQGVESTANENFAVGLHDDGIRKTSAAAGLNVASTLPSALSRPRLFRPPLTRILPSGCTAKAKGTSAEAPGLKVVSTLPSALSRP